MPFADGLAATDDMIASESCSAALLGETASTGGGAAPVLGFVCTRVVTSRGFGEEEEEEEEEGERTKSDDAVGFARRPVSGNMAGLDTNRAWRGDGDFDRVGVRRLLSAEANRMSTLICDAGGSGRAAAGGSAAAAA